jgi:hypothetical protein
MFQLAHRNERAVRFYAKKGDKSIFLPEFLQELFIENQESTTKHPGCMATKLDGRVRLAAFHTSEKPKDESARGLCRHQRLWSVHL